MKVLFLDIDGVLNREGTKERCNLFTGVDRELAKLLTDFLNGPGKDVKVVLSSTWRNHPEMWAHLNDAGITWIDRTPRLGGVRGEEIQSWLNQHPEVTDYVILDDSTDMLNEQFNQFVNTDEYTGVTPADIARVGELLKI